MIIRPIDFVCKSGFLFKTIKYKIMKKLVYGVVALAFVFAVSFTLNAQTDGTEKVPQTQKVEKKKVVKTEKTAKVECTTEAKKECTTEAKAACEKTAKTTEKACCDKSKAVVEKK